MGIALCAKFAVTTTASKAGLHIFGLIGRHCTSQYPLQKMHLWEIVFNLLHLFESEYSSLKTKCVFFVCLKFIEGEKLIELLENWSGRHDHTTQTT